MTSLRPNGTVEFRFYRPAAAAVSVAGDFCGWDVGEPMRPEGNGWWVVELKLEPGDYQFRYPADGVWYTDFASNGVEVSRDGWNSLLVIPERTPSSKQTPDGGALRVA